jgi:DNA-binding transcriptional LysR family regulator
MNINLIKFQILEELYKYKKITAVAEALNLKQPTITFHLKAMEKDFGVKLFESCSGKLILTEAGEALYHYASKINALTAEATRVVKEYDSCKGTIKIGASYVPATYLLPSILSNYTNENPMLSISLKVKTSPTVLDMLKKHEIDIGIISSEPFEFPNILSQALLEDETVIFFSSKHALATQPFLNLELLAKSSLILHGEKSSTRSITLNWLKNSRIIINTQMELDSLEAIKHMVLQGNHISVISKLAIQQELTDGSLSYRKIPSAQALITKRNIYYAINVDRHKSSVLTNFINYLSNLNI